MIEVHKMELKDLRDFRGIWRRGVSSDKIQTQFTKKGLVIQNKINKDQYLFVYNKVFNEHNHSEGDNCRCFIHYTKSMSTAAQEAKYKINDFQRKVDRYMIDGYPFERNQISFLGEDLLTGDMLTKFVINYLESFIKIAEDDMVETQAINTSNKTEKVYLGAQGSTTNKIEMKEDKIMNKITDIATKTVDVNRDAMVLAAKLEVGKVATAQLKKVVTPKLPMMVRGYADSPLFDIVLANAVGVALREYAGNNEKAQIVSEAMIQSAAVEMVSSFDLNGMIDEMLEGIDISKLTKATKVEDKEA